MVRRAIKISPYLNHDLSRISGTPFDNRTSRVMQTNEMRHFSEEQNYLAENFRNRPESSKQLNASSKLRNILARAEKLDVEGEKCQNTKL